MVSIVEWNDDLVLGVKIIDEHHQRLVEILNQCYHALMLHDNQQEVDAVMKELEEYTLYHFGTEKRLMAELGYPAAVGHLEMHDDFTDVIAKFRNRSESGESFVALEVLEFLQNWLLEHIKKTDCAFAAFLKEKGAA
jgi:hemerythrin-like metal-binding protein